MKVTLKDLLRHKFPMDETEQAVLLNEISDLAKELRERLEELRNVKGRRSAICRAHEAGEIETIMEILGES